MYVRCYAFCEYVIDIAAKINNELWIILIPYFDYAFD